MKILSVLVLHSLNYARVQENHLMEYRESGERVPP